MESNTLNAKYAILSLPFILVLFSIGSTTYMAIGVMLLLSSTLFLYESVMYGLAPILRFRLSKACLYGYVLLLTIFICYYRGAMHGTIEPFKAISLSLLWALYLLFYSSASRYLYVRKYIWLGIVLYVVINFFLWCVGLQAPINAYLETGEAKLLSVLGIHCNRVQFPITLGINGFGIIAGLGTSLAFVYAVEKKNIVSIFTFLICLIVLLMTDSRGGFVAFFLSAVTFIIILSNKFRPLNAAISYIYVFLYPILSLIIYYAALQLISDVTGISRTGGILSGRDVIWAGIFDFYKRSTFFDLIFGYGYLGQAISGVSQSYYMLFTHLDNLNPDQVNVHSSFLQLVLDIGLFGAFCVIMIILRLIRTSLSEINNGNYLGYYSIVFIFYTILAGATDLTLNQNNLIIFSALIGVSVSNSIYFKGLSD